MCRKCGIIAFSGFVICSGPCGGCFHHHCVKLDTNTLNVITANDSIHWFCGDCNQMETITDMHRKLDLLTSQMESFLGDWKRFCTPVLEQKKVVITEELRNHGIPHMRRIRSSSNDELVINPVALNRSLTLQQCAPSTKTPAPLGINSTGAIIEDVDDCDDIAKAASSSPVAHIDAQSAPHDALSDRLTVKRKNKKKEQSKPPTFVSLTEASSQAYQPRVMLEKLVFQELKETTPVASVFSTTAPKSTEAPKILVSSNVATEVTNGSQRNRSAGHFSSLRAALRSNPPVIGSGQSTGSLRAAERSVNGSNKCLLVTNLDIECATEDVMANLFANCSATTDNVKIIKLTLRNMGTYSSFKVWCPPTVFELALSPKVWPSGAIVREFIPISKNWERPPPTDRNRMSAHQQSVRPAAQQQSTQEQSIQPRSQRQTQPVRQQ